MRKLLLTILILISIASYSTASSVCISYFRSSPCFGCEKTDKFLEQMENKYPFLKVETYDANKDRQLFEKISFLYNAHADTPMIFAANQWFYLAENFSNESKKLEEAIIKIHSLGGCECEIKNGKPNYPKPVCILVVYRNNASNIVKKFEENLTFYKIESLNISYKNNASILKPKIERTPAIIIGNNIFYNVSRAIDFAKNYSIVGINFPSWFSERKICILFFYSPTCGYCMRVKEDMEKLALKYPLEIKWYNVNLPKYSRLLFDYFDKYNVSLNKRKVPAIFIGNKHFHYESELPQLEKEIQKWVGIGLACPCVKEGNGSEAMLKKFTVFGVILAGLADGINPCAFATLIFFISYMERVRKKCVLPVGLSFAAGIFISYFLIGFGILSFLYKIKSIETISYLINIGIGFFALLLAILSFYDVYQIKKGGHVLLQLPKFLKARRGRIIKKLTEKKRMTILSLIAFLTGFVISALEFVCTGQILLPTMAVIRSSSPLKTKAIEYLFLYNIMFIVPLLIIMLLFYIGYSSKAIADAHKKHYWLSKALIGFVLLGMAIYLLLFV